MGSQFAGRAARHLAPRHDNAAAAAAAAAALPHCQATGFEGQLEMTVGLATGRAIAISRIRLCNPLRFGSDLAAIGTRESEGHQWSDRRLARWCRPDRPNFMRGHACRPCRLRATDHQGSLPQLWVLLCCSWLSLAVPSVLPSWRGTPAAAAPLHSDQRKQGAFGCSVPWPLIHSAPPPQVEVLPPGGGPSTCLCDEVNRAQDLLHPPHTHTHTQRAHATTRTHCTPHHNTPQHTTPYHTQHVTPSPMARPAESPRRSLSCCSAHCLQLPATACSSVPRAATAASQTESP